MRDYSEKEKGKRIYPRKNEKKEKKYHP